MSINISLNSFSFIFCKNAVSLLIDLVIWQERQRIIYDEQKKLAQQQAQIKSQMARYEDELARKRMQVCALSYFQLILH